MFRQKVGSFSIESFYKRYFSQETFLALPSIVENSTVFFKFLVSYKQIQTVNVSTVLNVELTGFVLKVMHRKLFAHSGGLKK